MGLSFCQSPIKKLAILIQFKQSVIECIDKHRIKESESEKKEESESDDLNDLNDFNESDEDLISLCDSISSDEEIQKNDLRNKQVLISSDDMIPLFCFILVQSKIQSICAEIAFMSDFMNEEEKQMKAGYYLTTLRAATSALRDNKLPI